LKLKSIFDFLDQHFIKLLLGYLAVQLLLIFIYPLEFTSDSVYYWRLAQDCLSHSSFYPATIHLYEDYVVAPLYINLLVVVLKVFNSKISIGILNILINFGQLYFVFRVTEKIADYRTAKIATVIYIFYLSTLGLILFNLTELFFNLLIFASINFYLNKNSSSFFLAGILLAASIAVRPIGWALLAAYLIDQFVLKRNIKNYLYNSLVLTAGFLLFILLFGLFTYNNFGRFIFTSTTGSVNLIMGANDQATGAFNAKVFEPGKAGFIVNPETKTYIEKDEFWYGQAKRWIEKHPLKYISLFPMKLVHMFIWDDFSVHKILNFKDWNLYRITKYLLIKKGNVEFLGPGHSLFSKISLIALLIIHHIYYYSILFLFLAAIYFNRKSIFRENGLSALLLFIIFGVGIHLITVGDARYKYPYIISMIIIIAPTIKNYFENKKLKINSI